MLRTRVRRSSSRWTATHAEDQWGKEKSSCTKTNEFINELTTDCVRRRRRGRRAAYVLYANLSFLLLLFWFLHAAVNKTLFSRYVSASREDFVHFDLCEIGEHCFHWQRRRRNQCGPKLVCAAWLLLKATEWCPSNDLIGCSHTSVDLACREYPSTMAALVRAWDHAIPDAHIEHLRGARDYQFNLCPLRKALIVYFEVSPPDWWLSAVSIKWPKTYASANVIFIFT